MLHGINYFSMEFLEKLAAEGFTLRRFPPYERHLIVEKYNCAALLEPRPEGFWKLFSSPGYLLDGQMALLVEREGKMFFVFKSRQIPAEGEPLAQYERFVRELEAALSSQESFPKG